jgi:carbonic anhydrase
MTIPLSILEKINVEGAEGYAPYNKNLIRPNTDEPTSDAKELKKQTLGDDSNRKMTKTNTKLANTKEPKDGRSQAKFTVHGWIYGLKDGLIRNLGLAVSQLEEFEPQYRAALAAVASGEPFTAPV